MQEGLEIITFFFVFSFQTIPGLTQKIATIFQGLFKDHIGFSSTTY